MSLCHPGYANPPHPHDVAGFPTAQKARTKPGLLIVLQKVQYQKNRDDGPPNFSFDAGTGDASRISRRHAAIPSPGQTELAGRRA